MNNRIIAFLLVSIMVFTNLNIISADTESVPKIIEAKNTSDVKLIWSDEFDETALDTSKWKGATGPAGYGSHEPLTYYVECCEVKDGNLIIKPQFQWNKSTQKVVNDSLKSSKILTKDFYNFKYGKIEIRAKLPKGQGTYSAGWLLGANNLWPLGGEIDIFETAIDSKTKILQSLYCNKFNGLPDSIGNINKITNIEDSTSEFHTYGIIWDSEKIIYTIDGVETWIYNPDEYSGFEDGHKNIDLWPFNQSFYLNLSCDIGRTGAVTLSNWTKIATNGDIETYEDYFYIDYVRVYDLEEYIPYVKPTYPLAKVSKFSAYNKKGRKVKLSWKKVTNAKGYQITYARNKKFTKGKKSIFTKKRKYTVKKLKKNKTYYFKVRAYKGNKKSRKYGKYSVIRKVKIKK